MKKIQNKVLFLLVLLTSGCSINFQLSSTSTSSSLSEVSSESSSFHSSSSLSSSSSSKITSKVSSSSITHSSIEPGKEIYLDLYSINDFHGKIKEEPNNSDRPGVSKLASYLKVRKSENPSGYVFLNAGDLWQDTYDSAMNKGALLTEVMDKMECETLSLGNHEFDWGIDNIRLNKSNSSYTKFLGTNIRNYPNKNDSVDFAESYKIIERSGLRIGIIGGIGEDQITSITSSNWDDVTFLNPTNIIKSLSDQLRTSYKCDVIVLAMHCDESDLDQTQITKVSSVTKKKYVDAVFNAHSHQHEVATYNGVKFVQAGSGGSAVGHIKLKYLDGEVTTISGNYEGRGEIYTYPEDSEINSIVDRYINEDFIREKNEYIGKITNCYSLDSLTSGNLLATATLEELKANGVDCDIIINNGCRGYVNGGDMTREKIFNSLPFTNKTLVVKEISGYDIYAECIAYSNPYLWVHPEKEFSIDKTYTVAAIDYLMLHKNKEREYNYFKSYSKDNLIYTVEKFSCELVCDYLKAKKEINALDLYNDNTSFLSSYNG